MGKKGTLFIVEAFKAALLLAVPALALVLFQAGSAPGLTIDPADVALSTPGAGSGGGPLVPQSVAAASEGVTDLHNWNYTAITRGNSKGNCGPVSPSNPRRGCGSPGGRP